MEHGGSSRFISCVDYTTTSQNNYNGVFRIIYKDILIENEEEPNFTTIQAVFESSNHNILLKEHKSIDDFFDDLGK